MVLYLEIQSADKPAYHTIAGSKVCGCFQLVNSPFIFHFTRGVVGQGEMCMLNGMRQLEYDAEHKTSHETHGKEAYQPGNYTGEIDRQYHEDHRVCKFVEPEEEVLLRGHLTERNRADFEHEIFFVIGYEYPPQVQQRISCPEIIMLVLVNFIMILLVGKFESL